MQTQFPACYEMPAFYITLKQTFRRKTLNICDSSGKHGGWRKTEIKHVQVFQYTVHDNTKAEAKLHVQAFYDQNFTLSFQRNLKSIPKKDIYSNLRLEIIGKSVR